MNKQHKFPLLTAQFMSWEHGQSHGSQQCSSLVFYNCSRWGEVCLCQPPERFSGLAQERKGRRQVFPPPALCKLIIILGSWQSSGFSWGLSRQCHGAAPIISVIPFISHLQNTHLVEVKLHPHIMSNDLYTEEELGFFGLGESTGCSLVCNDWEVVRQAQFDTWVILCLIFCLFYFTGGKLRGLW